MGIAGVGRTVPSRERTILTFLSDGPAVDRNRPDLVGSVARGDPFMIRYQEIAFTAYAVTNMARARRFYEGVLGLKPSRELSKNLVEYDLRGGTLAVGCAPDRWQPSKKGAVTALEVVDFEAAVEHLKKKKIKLALGPAEGPICWMVGVRDPDGNMIVLHKRKRRAAGK
jgi:predicted enzyme related to lactoylglutathione lyase